jgi:hypothetical protein
MRRARRQPRFPPGSERGEVAGGNGTLSIYDIQFQSSPLTFSYTTKLHTHTHTPFIPLPSPSRCFYHHHQSSWLHLPSQHSKVPLDNLNSEYIAFSFPYPSSSFRKGRGREQACYATGERYRMPPNFCAVYDSRLRNGFYFLVNRQSLRYSLFEPRRFENTYEVLENYQSRMTGKSKVVNKDIFLLKSGRKKQIKIKIIIYLCLITKPAKG